MSRASTPSSSYPNSQPSRGTRSRKPRVDSPGPSVRWADSPGTPNPDATGNASMISIQGHEGVPPPPRGGLALHPSSAGISTGSAQASPMPAGSARLPGTSAPRYPQAPGRPAPPGTQGQGQVPYQQQARHGEGDEDMDYDDGYGYGWDERDMDGEDYGSQMGVEGGEGPGRDGMKLLMDAFSEEQYERFEAYRRIGLPRQAVRKVVQTNLQTSVSAPLAQLIAGFSKVFVGEMVEKARAIQETRGDPGAISPDHLREAYRKYQEETGRVGSARAGRGRRLFVR